MVRKNGRRCTVCNFNWCTLINDVWIKYWDHATFISTMRINMLIIVLSDGISLMCAASISRIIDPSHWRGSWSPFCRCESHCRVSVMQQKNCQGENRWVNSRGSELGSCPVQLGWTNWSYKKNIEHFGPLVFCAWIVKRWNQVQAWDLGNLKVPFDG